MRHFLLPLLAVLSFAACKRDTPTSDNVAATPPRFSLLPGTETGITFRNDLVYDREFNIYRYRNFYNGGGVAIGDVNNDGLADVFFTSNMGQNRLYLNRGNWKFDDVTEKAGLAGKGSWSTGVSMADVNGDGWLDIYVSNSGNPREEEQEKQSFSRENELFINRKDGTFGEEAAAWGLNDRGLTTHAAFFDYDRDGDLDCYVLNNSFRPIGSFDLRKNLRYTRDSLGGHKLYRNDNGVFTDVSTAAGILGSVIAFGLGVTVGDLDLDGWQDIYVSNDFFERDYLYYNRQDGTFDEGLEASMRHISAASMGADMADINNDGYPDIFVTDMLPEPDRRIKTTTSFDSPDRFRYTTSSGYYNQFTRNMLHLNNGSPPQPPLQGGGASRSDNRGAPPQPPLQGGEASRSDNRGSQTRSPSPLKGGAGGAGGAGATFSDIACLANAEATDWSWGALITDLDNDGWKDIYVANGIAQDLTNQDYLMFAADPVVQQAIVGSGNVDFKRLIDSIPSEKVPNYAFHNQGNLKFVNRAAEWGLAQPSFSNGSAYGDLDNDGDLDLVVNNVNMEAFVYRNETSERDPNQHWLKFELTGADRNSAAIGAKIFVRAGGRTLFQEQMPMRGFQSSMDPRPNFGLGTAAQADSVIVVWPTGNRITVLTGVPANQTLKLAQADANTGFAGDVRDLLPGLRPTARPLVRPMADAGALTDWRHRENTFYDWDRDRLLYFLYSTEGPRLAEGDVDGDGRIDLFAGGAAGQPGAIFVQTPDGRFRALPQPAFEADAAAEDTDAALFDADGDGDLDLYVCSGGNEATPLSAALADRLYLNDGRGRFTRKPDAVPGQKPFASACVRPADVDGDGDQDLFVGMRLVPGQVGQPVGGFVLINDGKAYFQMQQNPALQRLGLLTDADWSDLDGDRDPDLVVVGEWMPIRIFINTNGQLTDGTENAGLSHTNGLWKRIAASDLNGDGRVDFVVGNVGLNSRLKATPEQPLTLFFGDFDQNGTSEQLLCRYNEGKLLPYTLRGELVGTMPLLKKKYLKYNAYAGQTVNDIFTEKQREGMVTLTAGMLESSVLLNDGNGKFTLRPLPSEAQFAPLYGLAVTDVDGDGRADIVAGGNFLGAKPEFGFMDADYGLVLRGDGNGDFRALRSMHTGLFIDGEVRDLKQFKVGNRDILVFSRNNAAPVVFEVLSGGRSGD